MLTNPELEYKSIADSAPIMMIQIDVEGVIDYINFVAPGYTIEGVIGTKAFEYIAPEHHQLYRDNMDKVFATKERANFQTKVTLPESLAWFDIHMAPVIFDGEVKKIVVATMDITEKKNAEIKLESAINEKVILLKEVHHRAKNNLQVLSSILNLHKDRTNDHSVIGTLDECKSSIHSLALAHECLYKSDDFSNIDFADYIERFCSYFNLSINTKSKVKLDLILEKVRISMDKAITAGLILNEMMINSYKHGFPGDTKGSISISLKKVDNLISLEVADDGVGLQSSSDIFKSDSLGMELIRILVDQLDGNIQQVTENKGVAYQISFEG